MFTVVVTLFVMLLLIMLHMVVVVDIISVMGLVMKLAR